MCRPPTTVCRTSAAVAANTATSAASRGTGPAVRTESSPTVVKSARAPVSSRLDSGQPSAVCPPSVAARSSCPAVQWPRVRLARRSSSSSARASSNRSMTAWLSLPSDSAAPARSSAGAGPMPSARSRSVVGHMHTPVPDRPIRRMSSLSRWVAWTAVVRGVSTPCSASSAVGVMPCTPRQASFSAVCSDRWTWRGAPRSSAHCATVPSSRAGTARTECTAAPVRTWSPWGRKAETRSAHACAVPSLKRSCCRVGASPRPLRPMPEAR
ncbi:hypothetical protein STAL104432_25625 [Streptomyces albus]